MGHKYPNVLIHLVFATSSRRDLIPPDLQPQLWAYLNGIGKNHNIAVLVAGGTANHVHMLVVLPVDTTVSKAVQIFKANSSRWVSEHQIEFSWQEGYGAFSVSPSMRNTVIRYIENQLEHHKKRSFEREFETMLAKMGINYRVAEIFD